MQGDRDKQLDFSAAMLLYVYIREVSTSMQHTSVLCSFES